MYHQRFAQSFFLDLQSDSNCAWNSIQKEHHVAYVVEKKDTLKEGVSKNDVSTIGGGVRNDDT